jgi:chemotaxis protein histidine kinase CheA
MFCFIRTVRRRLPTVKVLVSILGLSAVLLSAQTEPPATTASTNAPSTTASPTSTNTMPEAQTTAVAPQPMATFAIGEKTFENVTLIGFDGANLSFSHAYGTKTLPIAVFTVDQVEALNKTTDRLFIDTSQFDLTPPSPEAVKEAEALVQQAGEVNGLLPNGNTPMIEAISNGRSDIIKVLIARNANVNLADGSGTTPLKEAEARGNAKIIALLKTAGAKHPPKILPKTPWMVEMEQRIKENRAKAKAFNAEAKAYRTKADSYRRKAAQMSRALASPNERQQAQNFILDAEREESYAKTAASNAAYSENEAKQAEVALNDALKRQAAEAEYAEKQEAARTHAARQQEAAGSPGQSAPTITEEAYRDPQLDQMRAQGQQVQADAKTVDSMMSIMESKTSAEKEIERMRKETKEKLAKVPGYVKYVVWFGVMFFVLGALWFIGLAFYDTMMWGLLCFFFPIPCILIYFIMNPREMWAPFALYVFGFLMFWIPVTVYQVGLFDFLF